MENFESITSEQKKWREEVMSEIINLKEDLKQYKNDLVRMNEEKLILETKLEKMESNERKRNLIIAGLKEKDNESREDTREIVFKFLEDYLECNFTEMHVDDIFRIGFKGGKRLICVKFSSNLLKELVIRKRKLLKGTNIWLEEDYPENVQVVRKELIPYMRVARSQGLYAILQRDRLQIENRRMEIDDCRRLFDERDTQKKMQTEEVTRTGMKIGKRIEQKNKNKEEDSESLKGRKINENQFEVRRANLDKREMQINRQSEDDNRTRVRDTMGIESKSSNTVVCAGAKNPILIEKINTDMDSVSQSVGNIATMIQDLEKSFNEGMKKSQSLLNPVAKVFNSAKLEDKNATLRHSKNNGSASATELMATLQFDGRYADKKKIENTGQQEVNMRVTRHRDKQ